MFVAGTVDSFMLPASRHWHVHDDVDIETLCADTSAESARKAIMAIIVGEIEN